MVTLAFCACRSAKMSYSSTLREAGMITGTSSNVTVVRIGVVPGSASSLLMSSLISSGIRRWSTPLPFVAPGRACSTSGSRASSLEPVSVTSFRLLPLWRPLLFLLPLGSFSRFRVELRKVTRKTSPSGPLVASTPPCHFSGFSIPAVCP